MPFEQFRLDKSINQSRGIFDKFIYVSADDTLNEIQADGYFSANRFLRDDPESWIGALIEVRGTDGYAVLQVAANGTSVEEVGGGGAGALVVATRSDNSNPAVFADFAALETYTATTEGTADAASINVTNSRIAREVFAVGTLDGSNQVTAITAAYIRLNNAWVSVATNLVGTPGAAGPAGADGQDGAQGPPGPSASFASEAARDAFYNASQTNRDTLEVGSIIETRLEAGVVAVQEWLGVANPTTYGTNGPLNWRNASLRTASASIEFARNLRIFDYGQIPGFEDMGNDVLALAVGQRFTESGGSQNARQVSFSGESTLLTAAAGAPPVNSPLQAVHTYPFNTTGVITNQAIVLEGVIDFVVAPNFYRVEIFRGTDATGPLVFDERFDPNGVAGNFTARADGLEGRPSPQRFLPNTDYFFRLTGDIPFQYVQADGVTSPAGTSTGYEITFEDLATQDFVRNMIQQPANAAITAFSISGLSDFAPGVGVELGGARTLTYTVTNTAQVNGNLTFSWDAVNIATDIDPAAGTANVNIPSTVTAAGDTHTAILSGVDNSGNAFSRTLTYNTPATGERIYIGTIGSTDASTFDTGAATALNFAPSPQTITIPTFAGNSRIAYAQRASEPELTALTIGGINQLPAFTKTDNAITVDGVLHDVWVSDNLLVGSIVSGETAILER